MEKLNRREFMILSAALAVTPLFQSNLFASNSKDVQMTYRMLGNLKVSSIGLGCMSMNSGNYNAPKDEKEMIKVIRHAYEKGVTFFDTAEAYGPLINEELVGKALKGIRQNVVVATKFGFGIDHKTRTRLGTLNSRPENIRKVVENSLKSLQTDYIDLFYQHRVDPQVPIEDVVGVIAVLIKEGKIKHFGMSEPGIETLKRAHKIVPVTAVQNEYSLLYQGPKKENEIELFEEMGIGLVPWSPLGIGYLAGHMNADTRFNSPNYTDYRLTHPKFTPENLKANLPLIKFIKKWAEEKNATPAQISLAWLIEQKPFIAPIPGTTSVSHLDENLGALNVKFTSDELKAFNAELDEIVIHGQRLRDGLLALSRVEAPKK